MDDIPEELERLAECKMEGIEYKPLAEYSAGDYAVEFAKDYKKYEDVLPPDSLLAIVQNQLYGIDEGDKIVDMYNEFTKLSREQRFKGKSFPEEFYKKLLAFTGLPSWYMPIMRMNLEGLYNRCK